MRSTRRPHRPFAQGVRVLSAFSLLMGAAGAVHAQARAPRVALPSAVPAPRALAGARAVGNVADAQPVPLTVVLPLRDQAGLTEFLRRVYDPHDPLYHQFLTPAEFTERFGATQADYDAVASWLTQQGFTLGAADASRHVISCTAPAKRVQSALAARLHRYVTGPGRVAYANMSVPSLPVGLAGKVSAIIGLDNLVERHTHLKRTPASITRIGNGQGGGLSAQDVNSFYGIDVTNPGDGQSLALVEFDDYVLSNLQAYTADTTNFPTNAPNPAAIVQKVIVDNPTGYPSDGQSEVELDIELMLAVAPKIKKIYVYEATNTDSGDLAMFQKIATDHLAQCVSISWGAEEGSVSTQVRQTRNSILQQMAAQGQSVFAAAGDAGAYDNRDGALTVDDPASQPYITGVGGTRILAATGTPIVYGTETTWGTETQGGGGGISQYWPKPSYQFGVGASVTTYPTPTPMRDVPDVALNADPASGYSIYTTDSGKTDWATYGGTSAAAPLWAAFMALVNQRRVANGSSVFGTQTGFPSAGGPIGFFNPLLYSIGQHARYSFDFNDIKDQSTNLYYPATQGYDDATGWGTFKAGSLLADLAPSIGADGTITGTITFGDTPSNQANVVPTVVASWSADDSNAVTGTVSPLTPGQASYTYSITVPSGIAYTVTASAPGYSHKSADNLTVTAAGSTPQDFILAASLHDFNGGLRLISVPYEYQTVDYSSLFSPATPKLITYSTTLGAYEVSPTYPADTLHIGLGYWVRVPVGGISLDKNTGLEASKTDNYFKTTDGQGYYQIALAKGWNLIGDPYKVAIPVANLLSGDELTAGQALGSNSNKTVFLPLYFYSSGLHDYLAAGAGDSIQPYVGYWIYAYSNTTLFVPDPATP